MGDHRKITQSQTSVRKFSSTGDQSYKKKSFISQFLADVGISIDLFLMSSHFCNKLSGP